MGNRERKESVGPGDLGLWNQRFHIAVRAYTAEKLYTKFKRWQENSEPHLVHSTRTRRTRRARRARRARPPRTPSQAAEPSMRPSPIAVHAAYTGRHRHLTSIEMRIFGKSYKEIAKDMAGMERIKKLEHELELPKDSNMTMKQRVLRIETEATRCAW
jgi:hypothetical protein